MKHNTNPWADAANDAVGGLYKYYLSQPNQGDIQQRQLQNQLLGLQVQNQQIGIDQGRLDLKQDQDDARVYKQYGQDAQNIPQVGSLSETPVQPGAMGPGVPLEVTPAVRNSDIADLMSSYAGRGLSEERIDAERALSGYAGALRFDDPTQQQLLLDEKITDVKSLDSRRGVSPGGHLVDENNQSVFNAPFKPATGTTIYDDEGNVIAELDGGSGFGKKGVNTLDETIINTTNMIADFHRAGDQYKAEYLTEQGKIKATAIALKDRLGQTLTPEETQYVQGISQFQATALANINNEIKRITGAQMSEPEAKRIRSALPDPGSGSFFALLTGDGPTTFKARYDNSVAMIEAAHKRALDMKQRGISASIDIIAAQYPLENYMEGGRSAPPAPPNLSPARMELERRKREGQ